MVRREMKLIVVVSLLLCSADAVRVINQQIMAQIGMDVTLNCRTTGDTIVGWFRKGTKIVDDGVKYKLSGSARSSSNLVIRAYTETDAGTYACRGVTSDGTEKEEVATIITQVNILKLPTSVALARGQPGLIVPVIGGKPSVVQWLHSDNAVANGTLHQDSTTSPDLFNIEYEAQNYKLLGNGSLTIVAADESSAGTYTLELYDEELSKVDSSDVEVVVGDVPSLVSPDAREFSVLLGDHLQIPSSIKGQTSFKWFKKTPSGDLVEIQSAAGVSISISSDLTFDKVTAQQAGSYVLTAVNMYGMMKETFQVIVYDNVAVNIDIKGSLKKDEEFSVTCIGSGLPAPKVSLFMGGQLLQQADQQVTYSRPSAQYSDIGNYVCEAELLAKFSGLTQTKASKNADVVIKGTPNILDAETTGQTWVKQGEEISYACAAEGSPLPTLKVTYGGIAVSASLSNSSSWHALATLKFPASKIETDMPYLCEATNEFGVVSKETKFVFVDLPEPPTNLRQDGRFDDKIVVRWDGPKSTGNSQTPLTFSVTARSDSKVVGSATGLTQTTFDVKGLSRGAKVTFEVITQNSAGSGKPAVLLASTNDQVLPTEVVLDNRTVIQGGNVTVFWKKPLNPGTEAALKYSLQACPLLGDAQKVYTEGCVSSEKVADLSYTFVSLVPATTYQISIFAENSVGKSAPVVVKATTQDAEPTKAAQSGAVAPGTIAGIIVAIILIVLLVVDVFCCFFHRCGFTHCCYEVIFGSRSKGRGAAGTDEQVALKATAQV